MLCCVSICPYLRVQRWRLEAELMNVGKKRSVQLLADCWHIQTALPVLFSHYFCIAWGSCRERESHVSILGNYTQERVMDVNHDHEI